MTNTHTHQTAAWKKISACAFPLFINEEVTSNNKYAEPNISVIITVVRADKLKHLVVFNLEKRSLKCNLIYLY